MKNSKEQRQFERDQIRILADQVVEKLKAHKVVIQRYNSYSSNSVYLKFDYGVSNSLRISDHKGKGHLAYRYNALTVCKKPIAARDKERGLLRFYYPINAVDDLVNKILYDRWEKIHRYGRANYLHYMGINKEQNKNAKKGFWSQAVIV